MAVIFLAEVLLFIEFRPVGTFFTPLVWTGCILFIDALAFKKRGASYLVTRRREFLTLLPVSVLFWLVFEGYNLFLDNWRYVGLPENLWIRIFGYTWSFAAIWPAVLETNELLLAFGVCRTARIRPLDFSNRVLNVFILFGAVELLLPILFPSRWWGILVWTGFVFLLDPLNFRWGRPSIIAEFRRGRLQLFLTLMLSGLICGFLWEFWNFWAGAKWVYYVPVLADVKIFEMPVVGYFGFLAFALEVFVMYHFVRPWLLKEAVSASQQLQG
ncbi:MAG: hypothetical protein L0196_11495 [candidate division Zixibacteria bacterium]|nr:hypothetical protein [candidate division Zixibacteria bacterium]